MGRNWLALAVLMSWTAWGQAPSYAYKNIVNASDYSAGPFAPNSVVSIFGSNLSWYTHALEQGDIAGNTVPVTMANTQVYVDNAAAPLLYVSPVQINFIIPGNQIQGDVPIRVVRQGVSGPPVILTLAESAPALFRQETGYAIATHGDWQLLTDISPAVGGEIVVIYLTGLGRTQPNPAPGELPTGAAPMLWLKNLTVFLDGTALPSYRVKYAGATPYNAGLYQLNLELPPETGPNPEIRLSVGSQTSGPGVRLPLQ